MNKIWLIIKREYWVRVRKKSFIIMTLLGPLLSVMPMVLSVYFSTKGTENKTIEVLDETGLFDNKLSSTKSLSFKKSNAVSLNEAKASFKTAKDYALLFIPDFDIEKPRGIKLFTKKNVSPEIVQSIKETVKKVLEDKKLIDAGINKDVLDKTKVDFSISTINIDNEGEKEGSAWGSYIIGFGSAFLLYISLFIYGAQVMRGVIEEKTSRIVEVMISSVKPIQLMMGKIIGVGLVGITQFVFWIGIGWMLATATTGILFKDKITIKAKQENKIQVDKEKQTTQPTVEAQESSPLKFLETLNIPLIIGCFIFYFIGGYLLYSALFAAVGAAVDAETDTQQFMLPITIPIIISFIAAQYVIREPDGPIAFWMSIIPFTSPIIMMVRLPFMDASQYWQIILSMVFLIAGFVGTTWLAARIYRVGILMYGKKVSYKELYKWLFYKA